MSGKNQIAAEWLVHEHESRRPFAAFGSKLGIETTADAYDVQRRYLGLYGATRHGRRAGYKIGVTSPAMQAMCGIDTPVAGVVFHDRVHASGVQLSLASLVHFGIEFEILVRLAAICSRSAGPSRWPMCRAPSTPSPQPSRWSMTAAATTRRSTPFR